GTISMRGSQHLKPPKKRPCREDHSREPWTLDSGRRILWLAGLCGDIAPLTGAWVKHYLNGLPSRRIDKFLISPLPAAARPLFDPTVAPALEQRADEHERAQQQYLPTGHRKTGNYEPNTDTGKNYRHRSYDGPQHDQAAASSTTAVPYATISLIVWPISAESNRIMTIALACMRFALR